MRYTDYAIDNAIQVLQGLGLDVPDELLELRRRALTLQRWLEAEADYKRRVKAWLDAEELWNNQQWALDNVMAYRAAKEGWLRMKEVSPAFDGQDEFEKLGIRLQNRYARFAVGALESIGIFDEDAWTYIDAAECQ
ncbi:hypothetical protein LITTLEE_86 [Mycobacterium phage LittleE]|uniref:Uncharacterized protein n=2 Tax=Omegavirus TaxID=1623292 RepID=Q854H5_BPMOM|nr:gp91 [Mycobacterium phage Omega]YP_009636997.1 hypothetical protein FGG27_gp086 [Mycobacterium phage LittleE]AAN12733.1 hypothetical protein PBI_OMEGA_91 [Mycobacterium phage Omega]AEK09469.1 hypothetical protein LITTLEE_86 [Mycobacterium phage LittleE]